MRPNSRKKSSPKESKVCVRARVLCVNVEIDVLVLKTYPPEQTTVCVRVRAHACMTNGAAGRKSRSLHIDCGKRDSTRG